MVSGDSVRQDASNLKSLGSESQSVADGLSSSWEGASHDNFVSGMEQVSSGYISAVESQMESFASACDSYKEYKECKDKIKETEVKIQEANTKYNEAVNKKDSAAISSWNTQLETLKKELETLKTQLESLKSKIESSLSSASGTSLSASSNSAHVSGTRSSSVGGNSKSGETTQARVGNSGFNLGNNSGSSSGGGGGTYSGGGGGGSYSGGGGGGTRTANTGSKSSSSTTTPATRTTGKNVKVGDLDMNNYPRGDSLEDGIQRAVLVAKYLMVNGGFTAEQAAAMAGVYIDENNCDPGEVMQAEKDGYGVAGTGGNGYGAGIASWTFEESKRQVLTDAGFDPNTPIESLSMQEQCDVIIAESQKSNKTYYDALKRCETLEDASATAVIITGGVGYSNNWDTHPTPAEAKALSDWYGRSNDANFGASPYHWDLDVRRLDYAREVYNRM